MMFEVSAGRAVTPQDGQIGARSMSASSSPSLMRPSSQEQPGQHESAGTRGSVPGAGSPQLGLERGGDLAVAVDGDEVGAVERVRVANAEDELSREIYAGVGV